MCVVYEFKFSCAINAKRKFYLLNFFLEEIVLGFTEATVCP
jgi:hypothetical protein